MYRVYGFRGLRFGVFLISLILSRGVHKWLVPKAILIRCAYLHKTLWGIHEAYTGLGGFEIRRSSFGACGEAHEAQNSET